MEHCKKPDQSYIVSKRARSTTTTSRDPSLPKRTTHEGPTSTVSRPTVSSPIISLIQFSLSSFASQFKANYGSKRGSSQDQAPEISRDQDQELEQTPSPDQADHVDPQEWEEGELASEEEDPDLHQGDPNLSQLVLTGEKQRDFDSFN